MGLDCAEVEDCNARGEELLAGGPFGKKGRVEWFRVVWSGLVMGSLVISFVLG